MPSTKAKFSSCGHRGRGASCHRCLQASEIEKREGKVTDEVLRLRGPQRKKGQAYVAVNQDVSSDS
jgi:hypothetical protein